MAPIFEKKSHTIREFVTAVLAINNERDARVFVEHYLEWLKEPDIDERLKLMRADIGYCFGEGMSKDKIMMWIKVANF